MSLPQENFVTLDDYYKMKEDTESPLEYIDGVVFMTPSPSTQYQRISSRLHARLFNFLEEKDCEVFQAPFDVELDNEKMDVLSPSNQSHDLVFKLNLYMQYGVKEYWIINPMLNAVLDYTINSEGQYQQMEALKGKGLIQSEVLKGFQVRLEELF